MTDTPNDGGLEMMPVLVLEFEQLCADAKELAEDVIAEADANWPCRNEHRVHQRKWWRDTETARRVLAMLAERSRIDAELKEGE
jgi:hypothetical protein